MKKTLLLVVTLLGLIVLGFILLRPNIQKNLLTSPTSSLSNSSAKISPSETFIEYEDSSGFKFSYPDNLSIQKAETEDPNTYADLLLSSKEIKGNLSFRITDSKLTSLDEWVKTNDLPSSVKPQEKKLGDLKALELKTEDKILLGALNQGVLFTIELPLIEQDFWMKVYNQLLTSFTFASPSENNYQATSGSSEEVIFEGEEVVE